MFLRDSIVRSHATGNWIWSENEIGALSDAFAVSKISIVRRLLTLNLTNRLFYSQKEREYAVEYTEFLKRKKEENKTREFGRNMSNEALSLLGQKFVRLVLAPYQLDRITMRDVSEYLNLKTKHIQKIEKEVLRRVAQ